MIFSPFYIILNLLIICLALLSPHPRNHYQCRRLHREGYQLLDVPQSTHSYTMLLHRTHQGLFAVLIHPLLQASSHPQAITLLTFLLHHFHQGYCYPSQLARVLPAFVVPPLLLAIFFHQLQLRKFLLPPLGRYSFPPTIVHVLVMLTV